MPTTATTRVLPVLVNPGAGDGDGARVREAFAALEDRGEAGLREVKSSEMEGEVARLIEGGAADMAVAGGDGTLLGAVQAMAGRPATLIPVPTGTLNHFARRHGIETPEQASLLAAGRGIVRTVPLGVVDDRLFLNTLVIGAYPEIVRRRERLEDLRVPRWPAAGLAFAAALVRLPTVTVGIETETERLERTTAMVWIGVGRGSYPLSHRGESDPAVPVLEVAVLRDTGRLGGARFLARLLDRSLRGGDAADDPAVELLHARSVVIHSPHHLDLTTDGEPGRAAGPLWVAAVADALRVRVPA